MIDQEAHLVHLSLNSGNTCIEATFNALGARQVALTFNGRASMQPYDYSQVPPFATGFTMAPWANRLRDGKFRIGDRVFTNPISEARTNTALHGLLLETVFDVISQSGSSVTFGTVIPVSDGYPAQVDFQIKYELTEDGFTATHTALNQSTEAAPWGTGAHPYPYFEGLPTADLELQIPASSWTRVDARLLPVATEPVSGTQLDTSGWVRLGDFCIDNDFLNLSRGSDGIARTRLRSPSKAADPREVEVWQDQAFSHVHVFSTPIYPVGADSVTHGITIEPVTAGPDAFNTGTDLIWLQPGVPWSGSWGYRLLNW